MEGCKQMGHFWNLSNYREALIQPLKVNSPKTKNPQPHVVHKNALEMIYLCTYFIILPLENPLNVHTKFHATKYHQWGSLSKGEIFGHDRPNSRVFPSANWLHIVIFLLPDWEEYSLYSSITVGDSHEVVNFKPVISQTRPCSIPKVHHGVPWELRSAMTFY